MKKYLFLFIKWSSVDTLIPFLELKWLRFSRENFKEVYFIKTKRESVRKSITRIRDGLGFSFKVVYEYINNF